MCFTVAVGFVLNLVDMMFSFSCKKEAKFKWILGFVAVLSYFDVMTVYKGLKCF